MGNSRFRIPVFLPPHIHHFHHTRNPRFFYGWYIVLCGFLAQSVRVGLGLQTFGSSSSP